MKMKNDVVVDNNLFKSFVIDKEKNNIFTNFYHSENSKLTLDNNLDPTCIRSILFTFGAEGHYKYNIDNNVYPNLIMLMCGLKDLNISLSPFIQEEKHLDNLSLITAIHQDSLILNITYAESGEPEPTEPTEPEKPILNVVFEEIVRNTRRVFESVIQVREKKNDKFKKMTIGNFQRDGNDLRSSKLEPVTYDLKMKENPIPKVSEGGGVICAFDLEATSSNIRVASDGLLHEEDRPRIEIELPESMTGHKERYYVAKIDPKKPYYSIRRQPKYYPIPLEPQGDNIYACNLKTFSEFVIVPAGVICFLKGTLIKTPSGYVPIEEGDIIINSKRKEVKVLSAVGFVSDENPYKLSPKKLGYSGESLQFENLFVTGQHIIYHPRKRCFVYAKDVGVECKSDNQNSYYHIQLPNYKTDFIIANGVISESWDGELSNKYIPFARTHEFNNQLKIARLRHRRLAPPRI
jgi:hypothetical protein